MVKIYIFYSYTHDKFITKYITGVNFLEVGHVNQYNQELIQIIDVTDLKNYSVFQRIMRKIKYVRRINSFFKRDIKSLKKERKEMLKCFLRK